LGKTAPVGGDTQAAGNEHLGAAVVRD